jgi:hypothetical protein
VGFSFDLAAVGVEQTFEAPADPQPIAHLAGALGGLGMIPGAGSIPEVDGAGGGASDVDPDCIADAAGDPDAIQKCLE